MMPPAPEVPEVSLEQAKEWLDAGDTTFVDVRDAESFQEAHVRGALNLDNENIQAFLQETAKDQAIVVYCYHGNMSKGATDFLLRQGFENVQSLTGGFEAWRLSHDYESGVAA